MKTNTWVIRAITVGAVASLVGCSGASPVRTTQAIGPQAETPDRQVLSAGQDVSFEQMISQLPQRISVADAERMLVTIDPEKITESEGYSVQQRRGGTWNRGDFGRRGHIRSFGRGHRSFFRSFRYFPFSSYYFPYSLYGGYYYPYFYGSYYPYLYSGLGAYSPYYYYNRLFTWANPYTYGYPGLGTGLYGWPGTQMAAPQPAQPTTDDDDDDNE